MPTQVNHEFLDKEIKSKLDPQKHGSLDRIFTAGMKIMFGKDSHHLLLDSMQGDQPIKDKLAIGITKLMVMMFQQSNGSMPPDLIIPAASMLMAKVVEYLERTGEPVSDDDYSAAMGAMFKLLMKQFGATDEHFAEADATHGGLPQQPQQPAPQVGGMLQGA